ncbi:MAG: DinB family protein [Acidimicrobiales bacterium]|nr:DinB family protein [Acidimicrobiales bacterium]
MERTDPDLTGDELTLLSQFLDYYRATIVEKVRGLDRAQLAVTLAPSDLTLAGLVKHLALVEYGWFQEDLLGRGLPEPFASAPWDEDRDWEFHTAVDDDPADLLALYEDACERSRAAVAEVGDLEARSVRASRRRPGEHYSLRWIMLHMIEETARHAGHADFLRQAADGTVGD